MQASPSKPDRALIVVIAITALIVTIALGVIVARGGPARLNPGSPEEVVQRYTTAVLSGDHEGALDLLTPHARSNCSSPVEPWTSDVRVTLSGVAVSGDTARVTVSLISGSGGGIFGSSEWVESGTFELNESGDEWLIDSAPWQLAVCPR